jgi:2,3-bisphosphoglycerate-independent phosphoglycerate mutase
MDIVGSAQTLAEQIDTLEKLWSQYDFFFLHFKYTDSTGEDGNFDEKVKRIEELDSLVPRITKLNPTVTIVTGDHSTPSFLQGHSWHPVPTLLVSDCCRPDPHTAFNESTCITGGLGHFEAQYLMTLALANAGRLGKYGAYKIRRVENTVHRTVGAQTYVRTEGSPLALTPAVEATGSRRLGDWF